MPFFVVYMAMVYARSCVQLSVTAPGDRKKSMSIKGVWDSNYCVPLLLTSSLAGIKRVPLTPHSQTCMFVIFATGVFLFKEV